MTIEGLSQAVVVGLARVTTAENDDIKPAKVRRTAAKTLANQTLDTVSADCGANIPLADHQPQSGMIEAIGCSQHQQLVIHGFALRLIKHTLKLAPLQQAEAAGKMFAERTFSLRVRSRLRTLLAQALNLFRPLARRALMILRPALVLMRARKPWVRLRRMLLG